ncbi:MAG: site-specific integrase [Bryobacterales bacterium]|nr:site-specific integrase [Bryobacterales bacterium]
MPGQIIKRGDRVWLVRIPLGREANGTRKYLNKTIHGTKKDAEAWSTKTLRDRDVGVAVKAAQQTIDEFLDTWLESYAKPRIKTKTFEGYEYTLRRYIRPRLGSRPLGKLATAEIQAVYNDLFESGISPRTIQYANMILKQALKISIVWRLTAFNPCEGVTVPRQQRKEMKVLNPDQARRFLAFARQDKHAALFELAISTGLRPSEYCALKWSDVDLEKGLLSINRSLDWLPSGGWTITDNKTSGSRRSVKLPGNVVAALAAHKRLQDAERVASHDNWQDLDMIFANETGGPLDRHNIARRHFHPILNAAGLERIRLYDLRHTAATLALSAGIPIKVVSEMLGHTSTAMTMDVYSHVLPHMQDEAAQKMAAILGEQPRENASEELELHTKRTQRSRTKPPN